MTVVTGRLPNARRPVQMAARLVTDLGRPITRATIGDEPLPTVKRWTTAADGTWSVELEPNGGVAPADSLWAVAPRGDRRNRVHLDVPASATPVAAASILAVTAEQVVIDPAVAAERARVAALEQVAQQVPAFASALQTAQQTAAAAAQQAAASMADRTALLARVDAAEQRAAAALAKANAATERLAAIEALPVIRAALGR